MSFLLDRIGYGFNAGINARDSDALKRKKIARAVSGHKQRGSFKLDAKPKIDAICGGDSKIIRSFDKDDWIITGDGLTPTEYYWGAIGCDGIDDGLGISIIGSGKEIEVAGNIYIDVDNSALTAEQQDQIKIDLNDICHDYFYVHFGYINILGQFIEYFVMGE